MSSTEETTAAKAPTPTATVPEEPTKAISKESAPAPEPTPAASLPEEQPAPAASPAIPQPTAAPATLPTAGPTWPHLDSEHPLRVLLSDVRDIIEAGGHDEIYGVTLNPISGEDAGDFHTLLILQKFLRANQNDVAKAKEQLIGTLKWRKEFNPIAGTSEAFSKDKFGGLGYITEIVDKDFPSKKRIVTWNVYGAVHDYAKTFSPLGDFIRWRISLMELGVSKLNLTSATAPIPDFGQGPDPYQGIQVHDYLSVSFLRMDPRAKAASSKTIELLGSYYPETLSRKFFVNVPLVMQWMFKAMSLFVSGETMKKFAVLSYGKSVAAELGNGVPDEYGGTAGKLESVGEELTLTAP